MSLGRLRDVIWRRRAAYRACFERNDGPRGISDDGRIVLADLFHLSGQGRSIAVGRFDPNALFVFEGKRQLYLHIVTMLRADDEDLWRSHVAYSREMTDVLNREED